MESKVFIRIKDKGNNCESKEISIEDIIFNQDEIEFRFPNYKDEFADEPYDNDDYVDSITYSEQKQIWNSLKEKDKEIERLNNIIDKLEDMIVIKLQRDYHEHNCRINTGDLEEIYDRLKELKGSDKD